MRAACGAVLRPENRFYDDASVRRNAYRLYDVASCRLLELTASRRPRLRPRPREDDARAVLRRKAVGRGLHPDGRGSTARTSRARSPQRYRRLRDIRCRHRTQERAHRRLLLRARLHPGEKSAACMKGQRFCRRTATLEDRLTTLRSDRASPQSLVQSPCLPQRIPVSPGRTRSNFGSRVRRSRDSSSVPSCLFENAVLRSATDIVAFLIVGYRD